MIYSVDGRIVSVDGNLFERRIKSLTFQIKGGWFPQSYYNFASNTNNINGNEFIEFISTTPNSITVNYGDGTVVTKEFVFISAGVYKVGYSFRSADSSASWKIPQHTYADGFTGIRNINFAFENPKTLKDISFNFFQLRGSLPTDTIYFTNLKLINISYATYLENIPNAFPKELNNYSIASSLLMKETVLPDSLFSSKIEILNISGSYNLSDNISSNFFKINQLKSTLLKLTAEICDIKALPADIMECTNINDLRLGNNLFSEIPTEVNSLINLNRLYLGSSVLINTSIPVWDNLNKVTAIAYAFPQANLSDIPNSWKYLYSLIQILVFNTFITTNARFNEFIDNFYELCTVNGSIAAGGSPAPYTNRFRNISWGHSSLAFTGAKVPPAGYVQGTSNGTPVNQGQKVYVLQNQYNHTITHA